MVLLNCWLAEKKTTRLTSDGLAYLWLQINTVCFILYVGDLG